MQDLSTLLFYVYGCHGQIEVRVGLVGIRKTSPSGGGLHPTEVYLLIMRVDGVTPGLYHYNVQDHALDLIEPMLLTEAQDLANKFTCGQVYPRWANVLFMMSSRFFRSYWKYRNHPKAYAVLLMDVAHLSQTFYLMCTQLGLGAFVTAAVNSKNIEDRLQLNGFENGVLAICGCGMALNKPSALEPAFKPYTPKFN
jgi:SagB-type dehydrogenase family enzyme